MISLLKISAGGKEKTFLFDYTTIEDPITYTIEKGGSIIILTGGAGSLNFPDPAIKKNTGKSITVINFQVDEITVVDYAPYGPRGDQFGIMNGRASYIFKAIDEKWICVSKFSAVADT